MGENSNLHSEDELVDKSKSEGMWLTDPLPLARVCDQVIALLRAKYELFSIVAEYTLKTWVEMLGSLGDRKSVV